jgi:pantoate--beta-alanine ligase
MTIEVARSIPEIRNIVAKAKQDGQTVGLVPTMGGLHAGHLSLIERAGSLCDHVVVSVFVNPTQFNRIEDFENYPGNEAEDLKVLSGTCTNSVFAPSATEVYPEGFATSVTVSTGDKILCDAHRPGHFDGVATVVTKLFLQTGADIACFGEKDYQQLFIVKRLVADLNIPIRIEPVPTVRETDGLALSSRNARLTPEERLLAPRLHRALEQVADAVRGGEAASLAIAKAQTWLESDNRFDVEYLEMRSGKTLEILERHDEQDESRVFIAANLGKVRLIDNIGV